MPHKSYFRSRDWGKLAPDSCSIDIVAHRPSAARLSPPSYWLNHWIGADPVRWKTRSRSASSTAPSCVTHSARASRGLQHREAHGPTLSHTNALVAFLRARKGHDRGTHKKLGGWRAIHRKGGPCAQKIPGQHFQGRTANLSPSSAVFDFRASKTNKHNHFGAINPMTTDTKHTAIVDRVIQYVKSELQAGTDPAAMSAAMIGVGCDLLRETTGRLSAAKTMHETSLALLRGVNQEVADKKTKH